MEVALLSASIGISLFTPFESSHRNHDNETQAPNISVTSQQNTSLDNNQKKFSKCNSTEKISVNIGLLRFTLLISLCLFSLAVLEATPHSWCLLLPTDHGASLKVLTVLYRFLIWVDCVLIAVIVPSFIGIRVMGQMFGTCKRIPSIGNPNVNLDKTTSFDSIDCSVCSGSDVTNEATFVEEGKGKRAQLYKNLFLKGMKILIPSSSMIAGVILGVSTSLLSLRSFDGVIAVIPSSVNDTATTTLLQNLVSQICAFGVLISAALNGFGSVSMPHVCLVGAFHEPAKPEVISKTELDLQHAQDTLTEKKQRRAALYKKETRALSKRNASAVDSGGGSNTIWNRRKHANISDESRTLNDTESIRTIETEIDMIETLCQELIEEVEEMRAVQRSAELARTIRGKFMSVVGAIFSIVLLVRLLFAGISIARWRYHSTISDDGDNDGDLMTLSRRDDPITATLLWLAGHQLVSQKQYRALSQTMSLLLTAFLSASQVRSFLQTAAAISRRFRKRNKKKILMDTCDDVDPSSAHCHQRRHWYDEHAFRANILAMVMGSYFLSCVVLIKMNLPLEYRSAITAALNGVIFSFRLGTTNSVFAISAVVSAFILSIIFGIRRDNSKRRSTWSANDDTARRWCPAWDMC